MAKPRDPRPVSEAMVFKAVKQLLEAKGFRCFRRNTGAVRAAYTSKRTGKTTQRFVRFSEPGMADLYGWFEPKHWGYKPPPLGLPTAWYGKHIEVEIKAPGQKPNAAQAMWLDRANDGACIAFWCDSVEMCEAKLKELGL